MLLQHYHFSWIAPIKSCSGRIELQKYYNKNILQIQIILAGGGGEQLTNLSDNLIYEYPMRKSIQDVNLSSIMDTKKISSYFCLILLPITTYKINYGKLTKP